MGFNSGFKGLNRAATGIGSFIRVTDYICMTQCELENHLRNYLIQNSHR